MEREPEPSRYQEISATALAMLKLGESGRFEFKRDAEAVTPRLLAALANWVALDPQRDVAHLLVGVDEVEDPATGLVSGKPVGLPKGLDKAVARVQDLATKTRPIPVDAFIVEEGVAGDTPFVRVQIRPTMPPHFDDEGRRQTRQGRSTRALTDDELLRTYLDREAGSFAARFRLTSEELHSAVGAVGSQVDDIADAIEKNIARPIEDLTRTVQEAASAADSASSAALSAESSANSAEWEAERVQRLVEDLQEVVEDIQDNSPENLVHRVARVRRKVWWNFTVDTYTHSSARADGLERRLRELLTSDISLDASRLAWELRVWGDLLEERQLQRAARGTQKWWDTVIRDAAKFMEQPAYAAPDLPALRAALRTDLDHEIDNPDSMTNRFSQLDE